MGDGWNGKTLRSITTASDTQRRRNLRPSHTSRAFVESCRLMRRAGQNKVPEGLKHWLGGTPDSVAGPCAAGKMVVKNGFWAAPRPHAGSFLQTAAAHAGRHAQVMHRTPITTLTGYSSRFLPHNTSRHRRVRVYTGKRKPARLSLLSLLNRQNERYAASETRHCATPSAIHTEPNRSKRPQNRSRLPDDGLVRAG